MKKILLLLPQNVIPAIDGGKLGIYKPMQMLAKHNKVKAIIFISANERFDAAAYKEEGIEAIAVPINKKDSILAVLKNIGNKMPFKFAKYYSRPHKTLIEEICKSWRPDVLICHHAHLAEYCNGLKRLHPSIQLILREHNVEYLLVEQFYKYQQNYLLKQIAFWQYKKTKAFERGCWDYFNDILFISDEDFIQFAASSKAKAHVVYDGSTQIRSLADNNQKQNAVLFSGSLRSYQNKINVANFIHTVWMPWKKEYAAAAGYELWITGDEDKAFVKNALNLNAEQVNLLNIQILGFVNDLPTTMQQAKFFLSPTIIGAGIRIKLLEALGCSCVSFITPKDLAISTHLKNGENVLLYADVESFNNQFEKAANDRDFYNKISCGASLLAKRVFSWQIFYDELKKILR